MMHARYKMLAAILLLLPTPTLAAPSAKEFLNQYDAGDGLDYLKIWLAGISDGYGWANARLENGRARPLYCQPSKLAITTEQNVQIIRGYVKDNPKAQDLPAGMVLLFALESTFPCAK